MKTPHKPSEEIKIVLSSEAVHLGADYMDKFQPGLRFQPGC